MSDSPPAKIYRFKQVKSLEHLYLSERFADVHFAIGINGRTVARVPAHKNLLAPHSDVMERLFGTTSKAKDVDICIVGVTVDAFKEFLKFFYFNGVELMSEHIVDVLYLGQMYHVKVCIAACIEILRNDLGYDSVCTVLALAIHLDHMELLRICEMRLMLNTRAVLNSTGFLNCQKKTLEHILRIDVLSCSEVELFEACMAWICTKSKQNEVTMDLVETHLGKLFYDIRFASMTIQQFCQLSAKYNQVLRHDFETITNIIVRSEVEMLSLFKTSKRHGVWNADAIVKIDRHIDSVRELFSILVNTSTRTIFTTNKLLLLGEFVCGKICVFHRVPVRNLRTYLTIDVKITEATDINGTNEKIMLEMMAKLYSEQTIVALPHPILVRPNHFYKISVERFPDDHCFYSSELKNVVHIERDTNVTFHNSYTSSAGKTLDLISGLHFNRV